MRFSDAIAAARAIIQTEIAHKVPGLSVAVAVDGEMIWSEQSGYADIAGGLPVTATTRFRIASVSKPLTAAGLALLTERGQLDPDAPIQTYLPDFPEKAGLITTRLLAGHLSGIRNYRGRETLSQESFPDLRAGLKVFENDPLESLPGAKFSYSSYNWNVIGAVMEAVTKQSFLAYMDDHVIRPLNLTNTRGELAGVVDPQRAQFYETTPAGKYIVAPPVDKSYKWPSGGFLSTAEDLIRFGSAHLQPGFLRPESLQSLFTPQITTGGTPTPCGMGWFVGRSNVRHGGDTLGGTSILMLLPASRVVVALTTNGSRLLVSKALSQGKLPPQAGRLLFNKDALAFKVAKAFESAQ